MCLPLFCLKCMILILFFSDITLWRETTKCGKYKVPPTYLYLYSIWSAWNNGGQSHAIVSLRCSIFSKLHLRHTVQPYTTIMNSKTTRQRYNTFWQHKLFNWIILFIPEIIHKSTNWSCRNDVKPLHRQYLKRTRASKSFHANIFFL